MRCRVGGGWALLGLGARGQHRTQTRKRAHLPLQNDGPADGRQKHTRKTPAPPARIPARNLFTPRFPKSRAPPPAAVTDPLTLTPTATPAHRKKTITEFVIRDRSGRSASRRPTSRSRATRRASTASTTLPAATGEDQDLNFEFEIIRIGGGGGRAGAVQNCVDCFAGGDR